MKTQTTPNTPDNLFPKGPVFLSLLQNIILLVHSLLNRMRSCRMCRLRLGREWTDRTPIHLWVRESVYDYIYCMESRGNGSGTVV